MLSRLWIRICSWLVPVAMRERWREEWLGEIAASPQRGLDRRVIGALSDAIQVRWDRSVRSTRATREAGELPRPFSVARRLRELGIRATLGARPGDLVRLVLEEGGRMAAVGAALGFAGGIAALRYTAHLADGIPTADWLVFAIVPSALALVVLVACYLPARRAGLVDPIQTLRE